MKTFIKMSQAQRRTLSATWRGCGETGILVTDRQPCLQRLPCRGSRPVPHKDVVLICRLALGAIRCAASQHHKSDFSPFFSPLPLCRLFRVWHFSSLLAIFSGCDKGLICRTRWEIITLSFAGGRDLTLGDVHSLAAHAAPREAAPHWQDCEWEYSRGGNWRN